MNTPLVMVTSMDTATIDTHAATDVTHAATMVTHAATDVTHAVTKVTHAAPMLGKRWFPKTMMLHEKAAQFQN